eukprot:6060362-Pyramimonas_sp.AAC.1
MGGTLQPKPFGLLQSSTRGAVALGSKTGERSLESRNLHSCPHSDLSRLAHATTQIGRPTHGRCWH